VIFANCECHNQRVSVVFLWWVIGKIWDSWSSTFIFFLVVEPHLVEPIRIITVGKTTEK
jgi:hypothetical protein